MEERERVEGAQSVLGPARDKAGREEVSCGEGRGESRERRPGPKWDVMGVGYVGLKAAVEGEDRYTQD